MFCDENGKIIDGDFVLAILAMFLQKSDSLKNNLIVSTQMSNLGFRNFSFNSENILFNSCALLVVS